MTDLHTMINQQNTEAMVALEATNIKQDSTQTSNLGVLAPHIIKKQATINIGTIGHVAHGKSKLVEAISGVNTIRHETEKKRNITIYLGYANAKIYKCPSCEAPDCYKSYPSNKKDNPQCTNPGCKEVLQLVRHVSFVDCPGHEILMATMLAGASIMDASLLLVASNMTCPQPQTSEHLAAIEMMKLGEKTIILQNKIDLLVDDEKAALKNYQEIKTFVKGTSAENSPIIPISAQLGYNMEAVCQYICEYIPEPIRDFTSPPEMLIVRSFDVNKPGQDLKNIKGGVVGGTILKGVLKVGDDVEVRPGYVVKDKNRLSYCTPIKAKVLSLSADSNKLEFAVSGGLIGVGLNIDPSLTKHNGLAGSILGLVGKMPEIFKEIEISYFLLRELIGVNSGPANARVKKITEGEGLMLNIGSSSTGGIVKSVENNLIKIRLVSRPVCARIGDKVTISRKIEGNWRLIGYGSFEKGKALEIRNE